MKRKKVSIRIVLNLFLRYLCFLLLPIPIFLCFKFHICCKFNEEVADIIISLLPMIFTIIAISLSLPSEKIYGVTNTTFRKIRKDNHFTFIEMIIITIIIFALYTIFNIIDKAIVIWYLDFISIIYSIWFILQEIPLLLKNDKIILYIIKKTLKLEINDDYAYGNLSQGKDLYNILQYIVLNLGLAKTYEVLKTKSHSKNALLLDSLLLINNDYLFSCSDRKDYLSSSCCNTYKEIDILTAIDVTFGSLKEIFAFTNEFNIVDIYGDSNHYYQITRMFFSLKEITHALSLGEKYNQEIASCLRKLAVCKNNTVQAFKYNILNAMLITSVSNQELWFLRALRDSEFYSIFNKTYTLFLSIYMYYLLWIDSAVPETLKDELKKFMNEKSQGFNSREDNWFSIVKRLLNHFDKNDLSQLLLDLLFIVNCERGDELWYRPIDRNSWSSKYGMNNGLVIDCWLEIFINDCNYEFDEKSFDILIDSLSIDNQKLLFYRLQKNWITDHKEFCLKTDKPTFLETYKIRTIVKLDKAINKNIVSYFYRKLNEFNKKNYEIIHGYSEKSEDDFKKYKDQFIIGLNKSAKSILVYDNNLELTQSTEVYFNVIIEKTDCEKLIDLYVNEFESVFEEIISDEYEEQIHPTKLTKSSVKKIIEKIKKGNYNHKTNNDYILYNFGITQEQLNLVSSIEPSKLYLPSLTFWRDHAIRFNAICDNEKTVVRELTSSEINKMIDEKYKVTDGLYKFNDGDEYNSFFLTRDELLQLISKHYFFVSIAVKYSIDFDHNNILRLVDPNEIE